MIGQFNKSFVVARLKSDLFILDQHACDERRGLEQYTKTLKLDCQMLLQPLMAEVSWFQAGLIVKYDHIFESNGMKLQLSKQFFSANMQPESLIKVRIVAMPQSTGMQFVLSDFYDLMQGLTNY